MSKLLVLDNFDEISEIFEIFDIRKWKMFSQVFFDVFEIEANGSAISFAIKKTNVNSVASSSISLLVEINYLVIQFLSITKGWMSLRNANYES